jgi:Velvet factor
MTGTCVVLTIIKTTMPKEFSVIKRQEPVHARMTGLGKGCRRMLDPPLVLQLRFKEELSGEELSLLIPRYKLHNLKIYLYGDSIYPIQKRKLYCY